MNHEIPVQTEKNSHVVVKSVRGADRDLAASLVERYFFHSETWDLFVVREDNFRAGVELSLRDGSRGYHILTPEKGYSNETVRNSLEDLESFYTSAGKQIDFEFIDHGAKHAGFSWRKR